MVKPSSSSLSRFEQQACTLLRLANETQIGRTIQHFWLTKPLSYFTNATLACRILNHGFDYYQQNPPPSGVLVAINHRTFFDQWPITMVMMSKQAGGWCRRVRAPVRGNYFYERPDGVALNLLASAGTMYPPFFRSSSKSAHNKSSLLALIQMLSEPGNMVSMHPEGTRNRNDDPYTLLPAQPGIGEIALKAQPLIIPVFINGLTNRFTDLLAQSRNKNSRREKPIIVVYGQPLDYSEFTAQKPRLALYKKCADKIRARITELGEIERELRAQCVMGQIADNDPRWGFTLARGGVSSTAHQTRELF